MKKIYLIGSLTIFSLIFAACTSTPPETATSNANVNPTLTNANIVNDANTNPTLQNVPVENAGANSPIPGIPLPANANVTISKVDPTKNAKPQPMTTAGGDNSEITTSLGQTAVETRTFKNHPAVTKVEVTIDPGKDSKIKVYLKNGQVKDVPYNKDVDMMKISGDEIAKMAGGAMPKTAPTANQTTAKPETKNPETKADETKKPATSETANKQ